MKEYTFKRKEGIEIVDLGQLTTHSINAIEAPHRVNFYQIYCFGPETAGVLTINFEEIPLAPNTILFVPADVVCAFSRDSVYSGKVLIFTDFFINQNAVSRNRILFTKLFRRFTTPQLLPYENLPMLELVGLMQREMDLLDIKNRYLITLNYLENIVLYAEQLIHEDTFIFSTQNNQQELLTYFHELVNSHYQTEKSLQFYCDQLHVNYATLNKTTNSVLGVSPKTLLNRKIVLEAKSLLAYTDLSIKEVCHTIGINEPSYFTIFFKKYEGQTPRTFREKFEKYK